MRKCLSVYNLNVWLKWPQMTSNGRIGNNRIQNDSSLILHNFCCYCIESVFGDGSDMSVYLLALCANQPNLASTIFTNPLWSGLNLLFVPKGSSHLESVEMTLSDPIIDLKQPTNIYSMMTLNVSNYYTVSQKSARITDRWIRHEFEMHLTLFGLAWSRNGPRMIRRWMRWPFEEATILEFEQERIMK